MISVSVVPLPHAVPLRHVDYLADASSPADPKDRQIVAENVMPQRVGAAPEERPVQLNEAKFGDRIIWWTEFSGERIIFGSMNLRGRT